MQTIVNILLLLSIFFLFYRKNQKNTIFLIISLFFNNKFALFGVLHTTFLFSLIMLFNLLFYKKCRTQLSLFPIKKSVIIYVIGIFLISIFDSRLSFVNHLFYPIRELLITIIVLPCAFCMLNSRKDSFSFIKAVFIMSIILFLYALFEFVTRYNPINNVSNILINSNVTFDALNEERFGRFRVNSLPCFSFDYGYISVALGLFLLYMYTYRYEKKYLYVGLITGFGGSFMCGSRTVIICAILSFLLYIYFTFNLKSQFKLILISVLVSIFVLPQINYFDDILISFNNILLGKEDNMVGSSFDLREKQLAASLLFFMQAPVFGNGIQYFQDVLGWGTGSIVYSARHLAGLESYIYKILLEYGICGIMINIVLFGAIVRFFLISRKKNYKISCLGITYVFLFLLFSCMTGTLGTWPYTMLLIAVCMAIIVKNLHNIV